MVISIVEKYRCPHTTKNGAFKDYKVREIGTMPDNRFNEYTKDEILYRCKQIVARTYPARCIKIFKDSSSGYVEYYKSRDWSKTV